MYKYSIKYKLLKRTVYCLVQDFDGKKECVKNRGGNRDMISCNDYGFTVLHISELENIDADEITKKYHGKNVWLIL